MEFLAISVSAFAASALTFYSGFGLGTLLMPVFALYFPIPVAVGLTAVVHLLNNLFKMILAGRHTDKKIVFQFGVPALAASFLGAWCLVFTAQLPPLFSYEFLDREAVVTPLKLLIAALMLIFAILESRPSYKNFAFDTNYISLGGFLSGFFGGLSGHQGALRSAFLIRAGLSKEAFIGTGIAIAVLVDLVRLGMYSSHFFRVLDSSYFPYLIVATAAAFGGAFLGNLYLKKITLETVQKIVAWMLGLIACLMAAAII